jgi:hypothetical protein
VPAPRAHDLRPGDCGRLRFLAADLNAKADELDDEDLLQLHLMDGNGFGRNGAGESDRD